MPANACRVSLFAAATLLVATGLHARPACAQIGEAAPAYAGRPLSAWQALLAQHLGQDTDEAKEQCRRAAQALGQLGANAQAGIGLLVQALQSPSLEVRGFAVDALGRIGLEARTAVPAILAEVDLPKEHINYAPLAPFRRVAARALGRIGIGATAATPVLEKALQNEDPLYRVQAALALWKIAGHPQSVPALRAALRSTDAGVVFEAVRALGEIGPGAKDAAPDLAAALGHADSDVRRAAADALVALGPSQLEPIAQRLAEGRIASPAAAAYALGEIADRMRQNVFYDPRLDAQSLAATARPVLRGAAPALNNLLGHADPEVRQTAVQALSQIGLLATPFLLQSLHADNAVVRPAAIAALTRLEGYLPPASSVGPGLEVFKANLVPRLVELMKHPDPQVRRAAYRAFARFAFGTAGATAAPLLRSALRDPDLSVRRYAFEALQQAAKRPKPARKDIET